MRLFSSLFRRSGETRGGKDVGEVVCCCIEEGWEDGRNVFVVASQPPPLERERERPGGVGTVDAAGAPAVVNT
jgi:hypothetical protein